MTLRMLVKKAAELDTNQTGHKITILAGAGVNADNVKQLVIKTGVREVHGSARKRIHSKMLLNHLGSGGSLAAETTHHVCDRDEVAKIHLNANAALLINNNPSVVSASSSASGLGRSSRK